MSAEIFLSGEPIGRMGSIYDLGLLVEKYKDNIDALGEMLREGRTPNAVMLVKAVDRVILRGTDYRTYAALDQLRTKLAGKKGAVAVTVE